LRRPALSIQPPTRKAEPQKKAKPPTQTAMMTFRRFQMEPELAEDGEE
jgi:hypothetical protein